PGIHRILRVIVIEAENPQIMPEQADVDTAEDLPDRADDVPRDQQWQRHQDKAYGDADAALGHVEGDENAKRDLDRQDDEGEDQVADERIPEAVGMEEIGEPVGAGPEERVVSERILNRIIHHRHQRYDRREGDQQQDRQDEEPGL